MSSLSLFDGAFIANSLTDWYNPDWKSRVPITINQGKVLSTQTNFPLLINSQITDLIGKSQSSGNDVIFVLENKTKLKHDMQFFESTGGQVLAWPLIPSLTDQMKLYMYYNNPTAPAPPVTDKQAVWNNYRAVLHMQNNMLDSSVSGYDGLGNNFGNTVSMSYGNGKFGLAVTLANNDFVRISSFNRMDVVPATNKLVSEIWFRGSQAQSLIRFQGPANIYLVFPWGGGDSNILYWDGGLTGIHAGNVADNSWHQLITIWEKNTQNGFRCYLDGVINTQRNSLNVDMSVITDAVMQLGAYLDSAETSNGATHEFRWSNVVRGDNYYKMNFDSQNDAPNFYTVGAPELFDDLS